MIMKDSNYWKIRGLHQASRKVPREWALKDIEHKTAAHWQELVACQKPETAVEPVNCSKIKSVISQNSDSRNFDTRDRSTFPHSGWMKRWSCGWGNCSSIVQSHSRRRGTEKTGLITGQVWLISAWLRLLKRRLRIEAPQVIRRLSDIGISFSRGSSNQVFSRG